MAQKDENFDKRLFELGLTRTVYSFYYPETKSVAEKLWDQHPHSFYEKPYLHQFGDLHEQFAETWKQWVRPAIQFSEKDFPYFYACHGSSEAIRDKISHIRDQEGRIHVFAGEYEGYRAYAEAFHVPVIVHSRQNYQDSLNEVKKGDWFFLSQPSSLDGNIWLGLESFVDFIETNCSQMKIAVDLCYVGTTLIIHPWLIQSPNIDTIFFSLSKIYGVYYHRIGGVFARKPMASLVGNQYFRNLFSLQLGIDLLKATTLTSLAEKYKPMQETIVQALQKELGPMQAADSMLLASRQVKGETLNSLETYVKRQDHLRVCLTPGLDRGVGR